MYGITTNDQFRGDYTNVQVLIIQSSKGKWRESIYELYIIL